jgi:hypothetical protein
MSSRRWLIALALVGVVHNALRIIASIRGAQWAHFNYVPFPSSRPIDTSAAVEIVGVFAIVAVAFLIAASLWRKTEAPSAVWASALWAVLAGALVGLIAAYTNTVAPSYGWMLFVITPFVMGFVSVVVLAQSREVSFGNAAAVSSLSVVLLGVLLIAFAIEGTICLVMAVPIALPTAIFGGWTACAMQRTFATRSQMMVLVLLGITPFGATFEKSLAPPAEVFAVTTSLDIPAAPERVWRTVLSPAKLAAPSHPIFHAGIAYPLASHIEGVGPAAIRYCDFSTGKLVEPVLIWKEGSQLRFTVASNPLPMQEWTPYAQIHPPHLEGFLASRQGEFRLEPLSNGGTRLYATTWYQHHMWPGMYWRVWSDYIIHRVHDMVLANTRERTAALQMNSAFEKPDRFAAHGHSLASIFAPQFAAAR